MLSWDLCCKQLLTYLKYIGFYLRLQMLCTADSASEYDFMIAKYTEGEIEAI